MDHPKVSISYKSGLHVQGDFILQDSEDLEIYSGIMFVGVLSHEMSPYLRKLQSVGLQRSTFWCLVIYGSTLTSAGKLDTCAPPCSSTLLITDAVVVKDDRALDTFREEVIVYSTSRSED